MLLLAVDEQPGGPDARPTPSVFRGGLAVGQAGVVCCRRQAMSRDRGPGPTAAGDPLPGRVQQEPQDARTSAMQAPNAHGPSCFRTPEQARFAAPLATGQPCRRPATSSRITSTPPHASTADADEAERSQSHFFSWSRADHTPTATSTRLTEEQQSSGRLSLDRSGGQFRSSQRRSCRNRTRSTPPSRLGHSPRDLVQQGSVERRVV